MRERPGLSGAVRQSARVTRLRGAAVGAKWYPWQGWPRFVGMTRSGHGPAPVRSAGYRR
eukprot:CAMPEP_0204448400 /NCGR_PEP_ID=MMETSP0470-20130426/98343_1 /ASSEMBLY_ACC=CAM_ASM_000385 /TAXON_ID=2969 /ORGANISM="Oxyrrhis marina" /LENGTH=58 /DNA_ID=CAMNT_0051448147 /DNA_START=21 /DNA_END=193 /DNA_ORIENTATION=+